MVWTISPHLPHFSNPFFLHFQNRVPKNFCACDGKSSEWKNFAAVSGSGEITQNCEKILLLVPLRMRSVFPRLLKQRENSASVDIILSLWTSYSCCSVTRSQDASKNTRMVSLSEKTNCFKCSIRGGMMNCEKRRNTLILCEIIPYLRITILYVIVNYCDCDSRFEGRATNLCCT